MRQVAQRPRDGSLTVVDAPTPQLRPGWLLIENRCSLISAGTERSKVELGSKSLVGKARARPDLARKVVDRARAEGVRSAVGAARERLDTLAPIGYSSAGVVRAVGEGVEGLGPGDRLACGGGGWANHAELVAVPRNLVARVPDGVSLETAAYATVGAIALHGFRRADAVVGERVGVVGLGLVGQLAVQIVTAAGCTAVGVDLDEAAVELARKGGALAFSRRHPNLEGAVLEASGGLGLDTVLVCASSDSSDPLDLAVLLARDGGRLVVVGDVPVTASRAALYDKELELRLSRSYGPGRYDRDYEERGRDLPPAYVRWTEQRNLEAFLELADAGKLDPQQLTTHRYPVEDAAKAYALLSDGDGQGSRPFGIVLEYPEAPERVARPRVRSPKRSPAEGARRGVIGAGSFARATLLPALSEAGASFVSVATEGGLSSADVAARFGFERSVAPQEVLADDGVDAIVIATRHSSHAALAAAALRAGKHVFVEKPLALNREELREVEEAHSSSGGVLMVGFNRRFAPLAVRLERELRTGALPPVISARVNAGPLPQSHWLHDPELGGGRLLGEGCHFVDLLAHLAAEPVASVHAAARPQHGRALEASDEVVATLRFKSGAVATLVYAGGGDPRLPKERFETFGSGLSAVLDDFRRLELYRGGKRALHKSRQDKGHASQAERFVRSVRGRAEPPSAESYFASMRATLALVESLRSGAPVEL
ncbi:MAG TPA: bi-domain-containing oxidoreductase [Thermoleophilaceae bacterium]|nr:bi-domain-containing oxidoreductase [Thermoleophilaceae bacterium]